MHTPSRRTLALVLIVAGAALLSACRPAPAPFTSSTPGGYLDSVTVDATGNLRAQGWAADRDTRSPLKVAFNVNGQWSPVVVLAERPRSDVQAMFRRGANYGFDVNVGTARSGGNTVCAVALNVGRGENSILGCKDVTRSSPTTTSTVPDLGPSVSIDSVVGWACSMDVTATVTDPDDEVDELNFEWKVDDVVETATAPTLVGGDVYQATVWQDGRSDHTVSVTVTDPAGRTATDTFEFVYGLSLEDSPVTAAC